MYALSVVESPAFDWLANEVVLCRDVFLLLGFWENQNDEWVRLGGHYVSVPGVDPINYYVAFTIRGAMPRKAGTLGRNPAAAPAPA